MGMANYQQNYQREQTGMVNYYQMGTCVIIPLALVLAAQSEADQAGHVAALC